MDDVTCDATKDDTLQDCTHKNEINENCGQNEGAGVECHNYDSTSAGKTSLVKGQDFNGFSGILIVGGSLDYSAYLTSAEVFNLDTGVTCSVGDMPEPRYRFRMCHGLVCGGYDGNDDSR